MLSKDLDAAYLWHSAYLCLKAETLCSSYHHLVQPFSHPYPIFPHSKLPQTDYEGPVSLAAGRGSSAEGTGQEPECVRWEPICVAEGPGQLSQLQAPGTSK